MMSGRLLAHKWNHLLYLYAGANMVIVDVIASTATPGRYRNLVESAVATHMNMIRLSPPHHFMTSVVKPGSWCGKKS